MKQKHHTNNDGWNIKSSKMAKNTFNPIRNIVENMDLRPNPEKAMISLSLGDPTVFGNLSPHPKVIEAMKRSVDSGKYNGYGPSTGFVEARKAVAEHVSVPGAEITADDVVLCSGCSCALDLCISAIADPGQNILVPRPGFPIYTTLANGLGIQTKEYDLMPENNWEIDLDHMESLIDSDTVAILVNNPSNPCGSVFSEEHLKEILAVAERHRLPIIADEIYDYFTFTGYEFIPMAELTTSVPILSCGGLTKRFLVPGWRLGWITIHDRLGHIAEVRKGLHSLSQRIIGSNTLVQGALPAILKETPKAFHDRTLSIVEANANMAFERLSSVPGLKPTRPMGAMYMMIKIEAENFPQYENDLEIMETLVKEQSVFCLPGKVFNIANYFRIVLTLPEDSMSEACDRIEGFFTEHYKEQEAKIQQQPCAVTRRLRLAETRLLSIAVSVDREEEEEVGVSSSGSSSGIEMSDEEETTKDQSLKKATGKTYNNAQKSILRKPSQQIRLA